MILPVMSGRGEPSRLLASSSLKQLAPATEKERSEGEGAHVS